VSTAQQPVRLHERFASPAEVAERLRQVTYMADDSIAACVFLADRLGKPILVEGPAGTGKTQLAKSVAEATGARLIRLQCYEGLDEAKALYEWNYKKQLLRIQAQRVMDEAAASPTPAGVGKTPAGVGNAGGDSFVGAAEDGSSPLSRSDWRSIEEDIFSEEFLLARPLLEAIRASDPVVLLVDEVDRVEVETEALLLEVLSDYQVSIPELGTVSASQVPMVFLTSNNTRELSEALKRRCLYLFIDYPDLAREKEIILARVEGVSDALADQVGRIVRSLRSLALKKPPSVSETLDWARSLVLAGIDSIDPEAASATLNVLLKHRSDIEKAQKELALVTEE
jgi:MoxR-like ATPase